MARPLNRYKAVSMDCYGTLIDWETGIWNAFQPLLRRNGSGLGRDEILTAFAEIESARQAAFPTARYPEILRSVHGEVASRHGLVTTEDLDSAFGRSVPDWPAFDDAPDALARLGEHYALVILSNVDRIGFAASNDRLNVTFDAIYTAEDIGSYKPDPANFEHLCDRLGPDLGLQPDDVLHVAQSLFHDHVQAERAGLDRAWIDRQRLSDGGEWGATSRIDARPAIDYTFFSMAELADAVDESFG